MIVDYRKTDEKSTAGNGNHEKHPSPENIMKIGTGFWASKVLLSAVSLELFTLLAVHKGLKAPVIKSKLGFGCTDRHLYDYLDTLTGFGFLQRDGLKENAVYSNTLETDTFLDKKKPAYIGGILEMMNARLYGFWGNLEEGLRTGEKQNEAKKGQNIFEAVYKDPALLKSFVNGMTGVQVGGFMAFAASFDFSKYVTMTDIGGSGAMLSIQVALRQPHMVCTTFDLPPVEPIAKETIGQFNLSDRIKAVSGDFFVNEFPASDIITMGNILHDWDEATKLKLMQKAYDALPVGGALVVIENIIDDERRKNLFGLMMSLNMLIETAIGFDFTFSDFQDWASEIGFSSTQLLPLAGPASAAIAYK